MKLLTITVPCYNSASYMEKCIESLLIGGEDVEILIVNDGSTKDDTAGIADRYVMTGSTRRLTAGFWQRLKRQPAGRRRWI